MAVVRKGVEEIHIAIESAEVTSVENMSVDSGPHVSGGTTKLVKQ